MNQKIETAIENALVELLSEPREDREVQNLELRIETARRHAPDDAE